MLQNVGSVDRLARAAVGLILIFQALPRSLESTQWHVLGIVGAFLVLTAIFRICPVYELLGVSTHAGSSSSAGKADRVDAAMKPGRQ